MKNLKIPFLALITVSGFQAVYSQEENTTDTDNDVVYELNPFLVETSNNGSYLQTNSNSGTRLSEKIKELPIPVEVITGQFIEDIGALNVKEALQFTAGLETDVTSVQIGENVNNPNAFRLRGYVSEAVMRNGFRVLGATDSVNISQVDVVRGPNALLYGIGNFGGVVNYITARPMSEFRSSAGITLGSWDFRRFQLKASGPVGEKNGFSVGAFAQESDKWYDNAHDKKEGISGLWEFKPTKHTTITIEGDYIYQKNHSAEDPLSASFLGFVPEGDFIDGTHFPDSVIDFEGTDLYADPDSRKGFLARPYDGFRWGGVDNYQEITDTNFIISIIHNFNEHLSFQAGYNYAERDKFNQNLNLTYSKGFQEILSSSPNGERLRASYPWMYLPQHPQYSEWSTPEFQALSYNWGRSENIEEREQMRAEFAYNNTFWNIRHTIIAGATYNKFLPNQGASFALKDLARPGVPITGGDLSGLQGAYSRAQSIYNYDPIRFEPSDTEVWVETQDYRIPSKFWERGYYLIHQGRFWNEKIQTVAGLRYDWIDTANAQYWNFNDVGYVDGTLGQFREYRHRADGASTDFNTSLGISYTPNEQLSIFALRATAVKPIYNQTDPTGYIMPPESGTSYEVGVKVDLFDSKVSGALSLYSIERDGVPVRTGFTTYSRDDPTDITGDPDWFAQGRNGSSDFGYKQDSSKGADMQLFLTDIVEGLQTVLNFSYNDYSWDRLYGPSFLRKEGTGDDAVFVFETRDSSDSINPNRKYNDTPEFSAKVWNKYTFRDGPLEGLGVGLGVTWSDVREATFDPARDTLKIIEQKTTWSAALSYATEIKGIRTSFQLNVYNLLDDDTVYGYSYSTPRNFRLSLKLEF